MSLIRTIIRDERGAAALLIAAGMVLFLGMAAMVIDVGLAFNERRQDQSAVDAGVMAGALNAINGGDAMRDDALDYVRQNLITTYSDADWQATWEGCVDPAAVRNEGGTYNFVALTPPAGWVVTDPANWCLSFESARGLFRVRAPNQILETTFGQVLGRDEFQTTAAAVAQLEVRGEGGILPFGIPFGSGDGGHLCLSSGPTGITLDPCSGGASGNFGTLRGRKFGNPDIPTTENCNSSPVGGTLAQNIAHGYDHIVIPDADGLAINETRDQCKNPLVDTLNTDTGFPNNGVEEGLVGPVPPDNGTVYTPRLAQSPTTINITGKPVDNRPLWDYLDPTANYGAGPTSAPWQCEPSTFDNSAGGFSFGDYDWDNSADGVEEPNESWIHMDNCIDAYISGSFSGVMFLDTIGDNAARFGYLPEFHESSLGTGNSWLHILRFRAIYLQTTLWKKGMNYVLHSPGEPCLDPNSVPAMPIPCPSSSNFSMIQLTAVVLPTNSLPTEIQGEYTAPGGGVNPYTIELFR